MTDVLDAAGLSEPGVTAPGATDGARYRELTASDLLATLLAEEAELDLPSFSLDDAWMLGSRLRQLAVARGHGVGIAIALGEQRVFHTALPGSGAVNDAWLERKFRVVRHYGHASLTVRAQYAADGGDFATDSLLDPTLYAAAGGGVPLHVRGALVGTVGVSGLEMHDDHALVVEALRELADA